ncbi:MAG: protein translocase subunit SecF [Calditrichaeota bacterium]|nr:protein translocase subunit SecF [Calditrichota bacterium]
MIRFIGKTNIDFQSKRHFWMTLSGIVILAGLVSLVLRGGPNYSIDFTGGLAVLLRSHAPQGAAPLDEEMMRRSLDKIGISGSEVKTSRSAEGEDLLIRMKEETRFKPPEALIRARLDETHSGEWQVVPDNQLNQTGLERLKGRSYVAVSTELSEAVLSGLLRTVEIDNPEAIRYATETGDQVWILSGDGRDPISRLLKVLREDYPGYTFDVRSIELVGPRIGAELRGKAMLALLVSWGLIILYLWWRFDLVFGIAAIIALVHDILITIGVLGFLNYEISMTVVGALLTLIGFSVNDTIVTFDRIRENLRRFKDHPVKEVVNNSINQTLARTIITSGTVLLVVIVLFYNGGEVLHGFALAMLIGLLVGTYSSIYIAAPILIDYTERTGKPLAKRIKAKS